MTKKKAESLVQSNSITRLKTPPVKSWFSSGCTILDLAVANKLPGGFPGGRITHIFGDPSTTKSVLALEPLGAAQRKGGKAFLVDVECSLDFDWAETNGVKILDTDKNGKQKLRTDFEIYNPRTIEETFGKIIPRILKMMKDEKLESKCAVSIDSLTALSAAVDLTMDLGEATYGGDRAKQFGKAYRKLLRDITKAGLAIIVIDQLRDSFKMGAGKVYSGGRAIKFYSDVQILLDLTGEKIKNERGVVIGIEVGFLIKKNKVSPPFRDGKFRFMFADGIDDIGTSLQWLKENKPIEKEQLEKMRQELEDEITEHPDYNTPKKVKRQVELELKKKIKAICGRGWYEFCGVKKQKLSDMVEFISRKNLELRLRKLVYKTWQEIYKVEERIKEKVRF